MEDKSGKISKIDQTPTPHHRKNAVLPTFCIKCLYLSYSSFIIQTALKSMLLSDIGFWVQHPFVCPETKNPHKKCSFRTQTSCKWSAHDFNLILVFTALSVHIFTLHFQTLGFFSRSSWRSSGERGQGGKGGQGPPNFQMNENKCVLTSTQP